MRCVVALMQHETNTFSPLPSRLCDFASPVGLRVPPCGDQAIEMYGCADFAFAAMVDAARERGAEVSVPIAAYGSKPAATPPRSVPDPALPDVQDKPSSRPN